MYFAVHFVYGKKSKNKKKSNKKRMRRNVLFCPFCVWKTNKQNKTTTKTNKKHTYEEMSFLSILCIEKRKKICTTIIFRVSLKQIDLLPFRDLCDPRQPVNVLFYVCLQQTDVRTICRNRSGISLKNCHVLTRRLHIADEGKLHCRKILQHYMRISKYEQLN